jgi:hypothetical protein
MTDPRKILLDLDEEAETDAEFEAIEAAIKFFCVRLGHEIVPDQCNKPEHNYCIW